MNGGSGNSFKREQVVQRAIAVFLRYGYARATMADIARAAHIARQTLYSLFSDKEEIFAAVVDAMVTNKLAEIRSGLATRSTLEARLRFACESWGAEGYDLVKAHPDAKDMFDLGFKSVCDSYSAFEDLLVEIVREPLRTSGLKISARDLAHVIAFAIRGFKDTAKDGKEVRRMILAQVTLVSEALTPSRRKSTKDGV